MSQPNVITLKGKQKKKKQNLSTPNTKSLWPDLNKPPIHVIPYKPPARSLTEVPLDSNQPTCVQPIILLSKPAVNEGVNVPSTSDITNKTTAANTVTNTVPQSTKKKTASIGTIIASTEKALANKKAVDIFAMDTTVASNASGNATTQALIMSQIPALQGTYNATNQFTTSYIKPLTKKQRRKLRLRAMRELAKNVTVTNPDTSAQPQNEGENQSIPVNESPQVSQASNTLVGKSSQGFIIPKLIPNQKPKIVLKTKAKLQTKPLIKPNSPGNEPGNSETIQQPKASQNTTATETPQGTEVTTMAPVPTNDPGFIMEHNLPPQAAASKIQGQSSQIPWRSYAYKYPKGIPRSFLKNNQQYVADQQMVQNQQIGTPDPSIWPNMPNHANTPTLGQASPMGMGDNMNPEPSPIFVQTDNQPEVQQPYSPSDIYSESNPDPSEELESDNSQNQSAQKRLSAFHRLGPLSQPKKPKLTINLTLNKEQPVREVINDTDDDPERYTPVHLRKNVISSTDEIVVKYLPFWPWRKNFGIRKSATARNSRSVMILEQEQMEEAYDKDNFFIQILVKGYPSTWTKERVLDAILDSVRGYSLIPCFTEFYQHECKFLTLRSRSALITLHKTGFYIHKDGVELTIIISQTDLTLNQIDFIPRIVLRKRIAMGHVDNKLDLSAFTLQDDISHFIYYPLNRLSNQNEFVKLQTVVVWDQLTELNLSHNRLTTISGFEFHEITPRLKHLNLSHNYLDKITELLSLKGVLLKSLILEGNPLCTDYRDPDHYIKVLRMMFPSLNEIDGIPIHKSGELAPFKQNYCSDDAKEVAEKFLEIYFPLLDSEHRSLIQGMYDDDAMLTITYCYKLRYGPIYRCFRNLFLYARFLDEGETDSVVGAMAITKLINRWPHTEHDPFTFTVDEMYHSESTTILRIGGILKLTAETLADDEHLLTFSRTVVLHTEDGTEYKIQNEMVFWDEPTTAYAKSAFRVNTISQKKINLKIESTTDEDLREKFLIIFMKLTTMDKKISERCLEINNWNLKQALEHFTKLLKLNNLDSLTQEIPAS